MENETFFRGITGILFVIILVTRKLYEKQASEVEKAGLVENRDDMRLIGLQSVLLTISLITIIVYIINPSWVRWSTISIGNSIRWLGGILGIISTGLLVWSHSVLGKNFFGGMKIREGHKLIMEGPYQWIRHPIYTAFIGIGIGFFLLTGNWLIGGTWLASITIALVTRLNTEEEMMIKQFGDGYLQYRERTGKLLPKIMPNRSKKQS